MYCAVLHLTTLLQRCPISGRARRQRSDVSAPSCTRCTAQSPWHRRQEVFASGERPRSGRTVRNFHFAVLVPKQDRNSSGGSGSGPSGGRCDESDSRTARARRPWPSTPPSDSDQARSSIEESAAKKLARISSRTGYVPLRRATRGATAVGSENKKLMYEIPNRSRRSWRASTHCSTLPTRTAGDFSTWAGSAP